MPKFYPKIYMEIMKIAILIDGGFFDAVNKNKTDGQFPTAYHVKQEVEHTMQLIRAKTLIDSENIKDVLFRVYFYDAQPFNGKKTSPQGDEYDFTLSKSYIAKTELLNELARTDKFCLRLGMLSFAGWQPRINEDGALIGYRPSFRQKGVDIKVGMDMVWIATHKVVDKIAIISGDSDFIDPIEFAKREGIQVYLNHMGLKVRDELIQSCDFELQ